jgi:hypothetical protein
MSYIKLQAVYRKTGIEHSDGNPLIESLPPLRSSYEEAKSLREDFNFDDSMRAQSAVHRVHHLVPIVDKFFQPMASHMQLTEKISVMIRSGYVARNPSTGDLQKHLQNGYERMQRGDLKAFRFEDSKSSAQSMTLIGCSGSGKTTSLNRILSSYAQVIYHPELNLEQVVYLKIDCSHNGSLKEICFNYFRGLDRILGSNYQKTYGFKRQGIETMLAVMSQLANSHALGVLVIDEIQHLSRSRSGGSEEMLNFFVTLVNTIGVPVILIGTPKAREIFEKDLRSARRGAGFGSIFWDPIPKEIDGKPNQEWLSFTSKLWELQVLRDRDVLLSESLLDVWYELSQGVMDIVVKLFVLSQLRAMAIGHERITEGLMRKVYEDELKPVHPMLEALRSGIPEKIARYSDLVVPEMDKRLIQLTEEIVKSGALSETDKILSSFVSEDEKRVFMTLKDAYPTPLLAKTIREVFDLKPGVTFQELMPEVVLLLQGQGMGEGSKGGRRTETQINSTKKTNSQLAKRGLKISDWELLDGDDFRYRFFKARLGQDFYQDLKAFGDLLDVERLIG